MLKTKTTVSSSIELPRDISISGEKAFLAHLDYQIEQLIQYKEDAIKAFNQTKMDNATYIKEMLDYYEVHKVKEKHIPAYLLNGVK